MRFLQVGLGVQGNKRLAIGKKEIIGTVDINNNKAKYKKIKEVPLDSYDSVIISVPDNEKFRLIKYALENKKNVMVEKPLWTFKIKDIYKLEKIAHKNNVLLYVCYNHRFEPHFKTVKKIILSKKIGKIYYCSLFYGNGTAKLVKGSSWRDKGNGVITDLGSHLLDTINYWFKNNNLKFKLSTKSKFENNSTDHAIFHSINSEIKFSLEVTLCMWKNTFSCTIIGSKGSVHIDSLCKWGHSTLTLRKRKFPSGYPKEKVTIIKIKDPTWLKEYNFFKKNIRKKIRTNLEKEIWIYKNLKR